MTVDTERCLMGHRGWSAGLWWTFLDSAILQPPPGNDEVVIAELLLGQEVPAADPGCTSPGTAPRPAVNVGALVADLVSGGVVPAGLGVRVGNRLTDLVARGPALVVRVRVLVRRLDRAEPGPGSVATAREAHCRLMDRVRHIRVNKIRRIFEQFPDVPDPRQRLVLAASVGPRIKGSRVGIRRPPRLSRGRPGR